MRRFNIPESVRQRLKTEPKTRRPATAECDVCNRTGYRLAIVGAFARAIACECVTACPTCEGRGFVIARDDGYDCARPCDCTSVSEAIRCYNGIDLPAEYLDASFDGFIARGKLQSVRQRITNFAKSPNERGFVLMGRPGTGKTHLVAALVASAALEFRHTVKFVDFYHFCARIRATWESDSGPTESEVIEPMIAADILVIDELGKGRGSEWELMVVDQLISRRYNAKRLVIATTNFLPEKELNAALAAETPHLSDPERKLKSAKKSLEERIGERLVSRLRQHCEFIDFNAFADYRPTQYKYEQNQRLFDDVYGTLVRLGELPANEQKNWKRRWKEAGCPEEIRAFLSARQPASR